MLILNVSESQETQQHVLPDMTSGGAVVDAKDIMTDRDNGTSPSPPISAQGNTVLVTSHHGGDDDNINNKKLPTLSSLSS